MKYIVELESGCWLSEGCGDPARTLVIDSARIFLVPRIASEALSKARRYRPFRKGRVVPVKVTVTEIAI